MSKKIQKDSGINFSLSKTEKWLKNVNDGLNESLNKELEEADNPREIAETHSKYYVRPDSPEFWFGVEEGGPEYVETFIQTTAEKAGRLWRSVYEYHDERNFIECAKNAGITYYLISNEERCRKPLDAGIAQANSLALHDIVEDGIKIEEQYNLYNLPKEMQEFAWMTWCSDKEIEENRIWEPIRHSFEDLCDYFDPSGNLSELKAGEYWTEETRLHTAIFESEDPERKHYLMEEMCKAGAKSQQILTEHLLDYPTQPKGEAFHPFSSYAGILFVRDMASHDKHTETGRIENIDRRTGVSKAVLTYLIQDLLEDKDIDFESPDNLPAPRINTRDSLGSLIENFS